MLCLLMESKENSQLKPTIWIYIVLLLNVLSIAWVLQVLNRLEEGSLGSFADGQTSNTSVTNMIQSFLGFVVLVYVILSIQIYRLKNSARIITLLIVILDVLLALAASLPIWYYGKSLFYFYALKIDKSTVELFIKQSNADKQKSKDKDFRFHQMLEG